MVPTTFNYAALLAELHPISHTGQFGGCDTAWWEYQPRTTTQQSPDTVVAIHGFRGDHHGLELFAAFWPEQRIIIPDLPGFGVSSAFTNRTHSIENFCDWLIQFVEAVRPPTGRLIILGHSFGSIVVSHALSRGLKADVAILVNPIGAPALEGPRSILTKGAIGFYKMGAKLPERAGKSWLSHPVMVRAMSITMAKDRDPEMRRFVHRQHDQYFSSFANRDALLEAFTTSVSHTASEVAEAITVPTLIIAAERDDITPVEAQHVFAARLPEAHIEVIPNVGHLVHYETPAVAVELMREFLSGTR